MPTLYLVRGVPGSGKSTKAQQMAQELGISVFETDDFFIKDGVYTFDRAKIGMAHGWNESRTLKRLGQGISCIVSNTLTTSDECLRYIKLAKSVGAEVDVSEPDNDLWNEAVKLLNDPKTKNETNLLPFAERFGKRNIHNVPVETILKMLLRWAPTAQIKNYLKGD